MSEILSLNYLKNTQNQNMPLMLLETLQISHFLLINYLKKTQNHTFNSNYRTPSILKQTNRAGKLQFTYSKTKRKYLFHVHPRRDKEGGNPNSEAIEFEIERRRANLAVGFGNSNSGRRNVVEERIVPVVGDQEQGFVPLWAGS